MLSWWCLSPETIKHEILHSIGIRHQHSRSDRDKYVDIMWKNINESKWPQFNMYDNRTVNSHGVPYDLMSIMHYPENAKSNNTNVTIRTHNKNAQRVASWNLYTGFSERSGGPRLTDIELVRRMYKCDQLDLPKVKLPELPEPELPECKYIQGNGRIPEAWLIKALAISNRIVFVATTMADSWHNCQELCFDNPECTEWTINFGNGVCNLGEILLQRVVLSRHLKGRPGAYLEVSNFCQKTPDLLWARHTHCTRE